MVDVPVKLDGGIDTELKKSTFLQRRDFPRVMVDIPVELAIEGTDISAKIINISQEGMFIALNKPLPISKRVDIKIKLPDSYGVIHGRGRIIWILEEKNKFQCGISFLEGDSDKDLTMLKQFIKDSIRYKVKIVERRKEERRKENISDMSLDKRKIERRLSKGIFRKCVRISRADSLLALNIFFREVSSAAQPRIIRQGRELIMFGCNSYFGLAHHPRVKIAFIEAVEKYGVSTSSSRILGGSTDLHKLLEQRLAEFEGAESAIIYNAGYLANIGCISSLVEKDDFVLIDEKSHASIIDACLLSKGNIVTFKHNDMGDLEVKLKKYGWKCNKLIITDGVFSMDGDIAKLDEIYNLGQRYNAAIMVDDAHATGVLGKNGGGTPEYFNLKGKVDIVMGTLSKALAGVGGFIVGKRKVIDYIGCFSRTSVFSLSLPTPIVASVLEALDIIRNDEQLRANLWRNIKYMRQNLQKLGYNTGKSEAGIIPVIIRDDEKVCQMTKLLENLGVFVNGIVYPAVKKREALLRIVPMATHSLEDLKEAILAFKKAGEKLNII